MGENKAAATFFEHPIDLEGVNDRVSNTVVSNVQERPAFDIQLLKLESDPTKGFVVVDVPASPLSPHMVELRGEYRYYGRAPGGNVLLTQIEVARLYERRRQIEDQGKEIVDAAIAAAPIQAILLARERVGLVATSFGLEPPRAGEEPTNLVGDPLLADTVRRCDPTCCPVTFATSNISGAEAEPCVRVTQRERGKRSVIPSHWRRRLIRGGAGLTGQGMRFWWVWPPVLIAGVPGDMDKLGLLQSQRRVRAQDPSSTPALGWQYQCGRPPLVPRRPFGCRGGLLWRPSLEGP